MRRREFIAADHCFCCTATRTGLYLVGANSLTREATMAMSAQPAIDREKLDAFVGRMLGDLGALTNAVLVHVGDQLGFYKAMTQSGPIDSTALARKTGTSERLVRE